MENLIARLARRLATLRRLSQREREMDEEMRFHLDMEARDLARSGYTHDAAAREARLRFGGVERHKEAGRDARGVRLLEDLAQDVRYAWRQCLRAPVFTISTLFTLALSIGASTFMYSFTTMTPVPFDRAGRLVYLRQYSKTGCPSCQLVAAGNALTFAASSRTLESIAFAAGPSGVALRGPTHSDVIRGTAVTSRFFNTIGVRPMLGRVFLPSDTIPGAAPVAIVSEALWRTRFGGDSSIIGRAIVVDGKTATVRGVIANDDVYPERTDVWTVLTLAAADVNDHASDLNYLTIGRLRGRATLDQAAAEASTVSARLAHDYPADFRDWELDVRPLRLYGVASENDKQPFMMAAGFVLLVACINLAAMLVAQLTRRRRELAVRAAMGAHATRITRQLLTETMLVCIVAGVLGIGVAAVGLRTLVAAVPVNVAPPGLTKVTVNLGALLFALILATGCGIAIALWPAVRFARPQLNDELRDGARSRGARGSSGGERLRRALVVAELAVAVILLAASGLLLRTEANIARAPVGLATDHVLTVGVQLPSEVDGKRVDTRTYFDRLANELAHVPGVTSAGAVAFLPLNRSGWSSQMFQIEGRAPLVGSGGTRTQVVTPGYFATFRIPIVRGRALTEADADSNNRVALVNQTLVRRFFPNDDPIGRVLVLVNGARLTVVGVVADVKQQGAGQDPGQEILMSSATMPRRSMTMVVRTIGDPAEMSQSIVKAIGAFDPNLAINRVRTMDAVMREFLAPYRVEQTAMAAFAAIAIVIATMGLYAIMSFTVAARAREFGVRLALGASGRSLLGLVIGQGLRIAITGAVIGVAGALGTMRVMQSRLYQVSPDDPATLGAVVLGIVIVAIVAGLVPARRALAVDPVRSLREE